jgi:DNA-binding IclR family transcriptional regulator
MEILRPTPAPPRRAYTVKSLVKALNILELLSEGNEAPYTLTQLSRHLHLNISTVHRLLANLINHGFVEEAPESSGYRLSFKVLRMGLQVLDRLDFRRVAEPLLQQLSLDTQEVVQLAILQGTRAITIAKYGSNEDMELELGLGEDMPLHCTGVGKLLLAYQGRQFLNQIARTLRLPRFTPHTITNLASLRKELEPIREQGYALDEEEILEGLRCVAGPVFDHTGRVIAAFSVAGPAARLAPPRLPEIIRLVCEASRQISFRLGRRSGG